MIKFLREFLKLILFLIFVLTTTAANAAEGDDFTAYLMFDSSVDSLTREQKAKVMEFQKTIAHSSKVKQKKMFAELFGDWAVRKGRLPYCLINEEVIDFIRNKYPNIDINKLVANGADAELKGSPLSICK